MESLLLFGKKITQSVLVPELSEKQLNQAALKTTGNPGSMIVPQYRSSKITVFAWGKNRIPKISRKY